MGELRLWIQGVQEQAQAGAQRKTDTKLAGKAPTPATAIAVFPGRIAKASVIARMAIAIDDSPFDVCTARLTRTFTPACSSLNVAKGRGRGPVSCTFFLPSVAFAEAPLSYRAASVLRYYPIFAHCCLMSLSWIGAYATVLACASPASYEMLFWHA